MSCPGRISFRTYAASLGEDFLGNFDLLIDNRHHLVQLQLGPGPMSDMFEGERLPVNLEGKFMSHRLIVTGHSPELSNKTISLQLDSGANFLYLFGGAESLGVGAALQRYAVTTISNSSHKLFVSKKMVRQLRFGNKKLTNVLVLAPPQIAGMDTNGVMPTSAFNSIFISHSQRFVIFDPSSKPGQPGEPCRGGFPRTDP